MREPDDLQPTDADIAHGDEVEGKLAHDADEAVHADAEATDPTGPGPAEVNRAGG